jgi:molybdopterin converting factor small subunit
MPRVRLFGPAADAAGTRIDTVPDTSVEAVLATMQDRYGDEFTLVARTCRVWVNGEEPELGLSLGDGDEVALLPPVSGG